MSNRKAELREAALRYLLRNGAANVSLRPMAAALGTSARMLVFHFGSKEGLIQDVMQELHARLRLSLQGMTSPDQPARTPPLKRFWEWAAARQNLPYLRLLYEVQIIATQNPRQYGAYLKKTSQDWHRAALEAMSAPHRSPETATLCIAVFDGLFLELVAGGDQRQLTAALDRFIAMMNAASPRPGKADTEHGRLPGAAAGGRR